MKQMAAETKGFNTKVKQAMPPPPPPPPPPLSKKNVVIVSVTNREIAKFWRQKRIEEEDHLLAAIKAAARIRALKLTEDDYKRFEESLREDNDIEAEDPKMENSSKKDENGKELRVGIKDWWKKSKYAYLNQPAIGAMDKPKHRASTYMPNFCNFEPPPPPTASFGIF